MSCGCDGCKDYEQGLEAALATPAIRELQAELKRQKALVVELTDELSETLDERDVARDEVARLKAAVNGLTQRLIEERETNERLRHLLRARNPCEHLNRQPLAFGEAKLWRCPECDHVNVSEAEEARAEEEEADPSNPTTAQDRARSR